MNVCVCVTVCMCSYAVVWYMKSRVDSQFNYAGQISSNPLQPLPFHFNTAQVLLSVGSLCFYEDLSLVFNYVSSYVHVCK